MLAAAQLAPVLETNADLVAQALREIYADQGSAVGLDALSEVARNSNGLFSVSDLLASALRKHGLEGRFVNYLRPRGIDLEPADLHALGELGAPDFCDGAADVPIAGDFPFDVLSRFTRQASAFRCLIRIDGAEMGSGAFVSPRLVLTAAHVVETVTEASVGNDEATDLPKLEIVASDGRTYAARLAWFLPCHGSELDGKLPPANCASAHSDTALLRVDRPLGQLYGAIDLPNPPVDWIGCGPFILVHFPDGLRKDFCPGWIRRNGAKDIRQDHNILTQGGSSGGPGFDRDGKFLGVHQGRWRNVRRLVPYSQFADNAGFRAQIESDCPPRYLWSLDGSLDGHIVIGRSAFFDGLTAILEDSAPMLRGLWIKRAHTNRMEGLSFSFHLLEAFLNTRGQGHQTVRLATGFETPDLIGELERLVFDADTGTAPYPGVQQDETTTVAHDDERTRRLADALSAHAVAGARTLWIYIDNPPSGLLQESQIQLEHLVEELIRRPALRLILAGFETYDLLPEQFSNVAAARQSAAPGLMVEYLANFQRKDVETTARGISASLGLRWQGDLLSEMVNRALRDIPELAANVYALDMLPTVADNLKREAKASYA